LTEAIVTANARFNICVEALGPETRLQSVESMLMSQGPHGKTVIDRGELQSDTISLFKTNDSSWIIILGLPAFFVVDELVSLQGTLTVGRHDQRRWLESDGVAIDFYSTFLVVETDVNSVIGDETQTTELPAVDPTAGQKEGKNAIAWQWLLLIGTAVVFALGFAYFGIRHGWIAGGQVPEKDDGFSAPYSDAVPDEGNGSDHDAVNLSDMALPSASMLAEDGSNAV
jgi:hypothetical protein